MRCSRCAWPRPSPRFRADRAINRAVYGEHPYGHTDPTVEAINATSEELLRSEHAKRFRPDRALLVIAGRIKEAEAMKLAQQAFGDWKASGPALRKRRRRRWRAKPARMVLERSGSVQSTIRLGGPGIAATAADQVPLRLASTILGGGFSSRVNINLREEKGYTYGASAGARMNREGGSIVGGADVRNEVTGAALTEYFNEYKRIGSELVSKRRNADAQALRRRRLPAEQPDAARGRQHAGGNWLVGLPAEFLGQYVPLIQKVTPEQVRDVSKKYFAPEKQSIVVVGDRRPSGEQLKAFGEFSGHRQVRWRSWARMPNECPRRRVHPVAP
jgi:zinc protease